MTELDTASFSIVLFGEGNGNSTPVFLPGENPMVLTEGSAAA